MALLDLWPLFQREPAEPAPTKRRFAGMPVAFAPNTEFPKLETEKVTITASFDAERRATHRVRASFTVHRLAPVRRFAGTQASFTALRLSPKVATRPDSVTAGFTARRRAFHRVAEQFEAERRVPHTVAATVESQRLSWPSVRVPISARRATQATVVSRREDAEEHELLVAGLV